MNIAVIGDGGWGTTLAIHLSKLGHSIKLWGAFPDYIKTIKKTRENDKFLSGIKIPAAVDVTSDLREALTQVEVAVLAVPSQYMREVLAKIKECDYSEARFVSATKGIENDTLLRVSEIVNETLGDVKICVLSGPSIAYEVAREMPTTVVAASKDLDYAKEIQAAFMSEYFRVYVTTDVVGVELGGSLKNVIAIASGIADGLGFGANSKAAILTRGAQELMRLGVAMGGQKETFSGLSGMGDLITTCMSKRSRNRWLGEELGKGKKPQDIINSTEMAVEGFITAKSARDLAVKHKVDMPIIAEVYNILYHARDPKEAVRSLMTRSAKDET